MTKEKKERDDWDGFIRDMVKRGIWIVDRRHGHTERYGGMLNDF